ncbi:MAG: molybdopterin-dependent oxidoreductase [Deltaproteobacteria bacterium]|nr:molybdopterin-dependent oxidoreductase [Deltaproteobacteria bacterium]
MTATTCGECLAACGVRVEGGHLIGDASHPITRGYLCQNGRAALGLVGHSGRLRRPSVRGRDVPWASALDAAAAAVRRALALGGPQAVGLYFGAGDPAGSMAFLAASGFLQGLGSRQHYNVIGLEATHRYVVAEAMFGDPLLVPRADVDHCGALLALGTNPLVSNDEGGLAEALGSLRRRGAQLVVLDPRRTELARQATVHLQLKPGSDAEVLLAMLDVLFRDGLVAADAPRAGLQALRELAASMPPDRAAALAGVSAEDIRRAARCLGGARPVAALTRLGVAMSRRASVNEWLALAIPAVLGDLGRRGGMVHNPGFLDIRAMLRRNPSPPGSILGVRPPAELVPAILSDAPDRLRVLVVVAADLLESLPNTTRVAAALARLDALIVLDVVPTATTARASIVLPVAHHLEKDDVSLLLPDRVPRRFAQVSPAVASPPGEARSEVAVLAELAQRLGRPLFGARAIDRLVRAVTWLDGRGGHEGPLSPRAAMRVVLPLMSKFTLRWRALMKGVSGPHNGALDGAELRGAVELAPPRLLAAARQALEVGPPTGMVLSTCTRDRGFINGKLRPLGRGAEGLILHLAPGDAERLGLQAGESARVRTRTGEVVVACAIDDSLRPGFAHIPFGSPGLNQLTDDSDCDPLSHIPALANVPCQISREKEAAS